MKYVAILERETELSEEIIEFVKGKVYVGTPTQFHCNITSIKQAPEEEPVLVPCEYRENDYAEGYNQALKDCGVIEDDN